MHRIPFHSSPRPLTLPFHRIPSLHSRPNNSPSRPHPPFSGNISPDSAWIPSKMTYFPRNVDSDSQYYNPILHHANGVAIWRYRCPCRPPLLPPSRFPPPPPPPTSAFLGIFQRQRHVYLKGATPSKRRHLLEVYPLPPFPLILYNPYAFSLSLSLSLGIFQQQEHGYLLCGYFKIRRMCAFGKKSDPHLNA